MSYYTSIWYDAVSGIPLEEYLKIFLCILEKGPYCGPRE
jgi:hypothetical protein